jgi:hypothetical protein
MTFQSYDEKVQVFCRVCGKAEWTDPPPVGDMECVYQLVWCWYCQTCTENLQEFERSMVTFQLR